MMIGYVQEGLTAFKFGPKLEVPYGMKKAYDDGYLWIAARIRRTLASINAKWLNSDILENKKIEWFVSDYSIHLYTKKKEQKHIRIEKKQPIVSYLKIKKIYA